jgi:ABC-type bacteriocin/lantibiotic exporter with double-glycine peptidase domain
MTGIIGKSGCGKTTLIDLIAGLQKAEQGTILVDGVILTPDLLPGWRSGLGYLPQDPFFIDGTIRENLIWDSGKEVSDEQIFQVLEQVNGAQLVSAQQHGLDTILANYQYHFSGGERQRLALARVLIRKPKLLLLDEATSALDPANEAQIMDCLVHLKREITIVFVSHRQNLRPYFDKIIDLDPI